MEAEKASNSQSNSEHEDQCWRYYNIWLQIITQSHSNQNSMILAQKQTWRPVEQSRRSIHKPMQLYPSDFWQRCLNIWWIKDNLFN
jgi:hypothetical protein